LSYQSITYIKGLFSFLSQLFISAPAFNNSYTILEYLFYIEIIKAVLPY